MKTYPFTKLFVFPNDRVHTCDTGVKYRYMKACFTHDAAYEYQNRCLENGDFSWSVQEPTPIEFSKDYPVVIRLNKLNPFGPKSFWACLDLDNGNVDDRHGKVYVFAFETRKQAREFAKYQNHQAAQKDSTKVRVSQPFQLFQG